MDPNSHILDSTFRSLDSPRPAAGTDQSTTSDHHNHSNFDDQLSAGFFDFFDHDWVDDQEDHPAFLVSGYPQDPLLYATSDATGSSVHRQPITNNRGGGSERETEVREKIAFKTKSEIEILDDGFKWRKYGKKMVKNSPNPRNYYRCAMEGCPVKKRVERDREDPGYVITTYEGIHNHEGPFSL